MTSFKDNIKRYFKNAGAVVSEEGNFIIITKDNEKKYISINPEIGDLLADYGHADNVYYAFDYYGLLAMEEI